MSWTEEDRQKMLSLGKTQAANKLVLAQEEEKKGLLTELLELEETVKKENRRQEEKERIIKERLSAIEVLLEDIRRTFKCM